MVKKHYEDGTWNKAKVRVVVGKVYGITPEEYEEITGEKY